MSFFSCLQSDQGIPRSPPRPPTQPTSDRHHPIGQQWIDWRFRGISPRERVSLHRFTPKSWNRLQLQALPPVGPAKRVQDFWNHGEQRKDAGRRYGESVEPNSQRRGRLCDRQPLSSREGVPKLTDLSSIFHSMG